MMIPPALMAKAGAMASSVGFRLVVVGVAALAVFLAGIKLSEWRWSGKYNALVADYALKSGAAQKEQRDKERALFAAREIVEGNYAKRLEETARERDAAARDRERVRDLYLAYIGRAGANPAPIAESADAGTVRRLLGEAERLAGEAVRLLAAADDLAGAGAAATAQCRDKVTGLQAYALSVCAPP